MYYVRRLNLNSNKDLCDKIAQESGKLYSQTVKFFWRTVRKKNLWLKPSSLMRLFNSHQMHAHSADASVQQFFNALKSWKEVRKVVPGAKPPKRVRKYCSVIWKNSAIRVKNRQLVLSNGRQTKSFVLEWKHDLTPTLVTLRWTGTKYELVFCYKEDTPDNKFQEPEQAVAIDIGQIHVVATSEGTILNGRLLRSIRQGRQRSNSVLEKRMSRKKKGSKRWKRLRETKRCLNRKVTNKAKDILHKYTTGLTKYLQKQYNVLVVGDLTGYRVENNCGSKRNQENHAWLYSKISWYIKYKWERLGLKHVLQEESYTSQTCPTCGNRKKPKGREYKCKCGFVGHRDLVGATNILRKYLRTFGSQTFPVDALMARASGVRYNSHISVTHGLCL